MILRSEVRDGFIKLTSIETLQEKHYGRELYETFTDLAT